MRVERINTTDEAIVKAVDELKGMIANHYPTASFAVSEGDDPEGVYLIATVDVEDTTKVMEVVGDRLLELGVDEGLPVYVVPIHTPERVAKAMQAASSPGQFSRARAALEEGSTPLPPSI